MISKHKLYKITLVSMVMVLMLVSTAGAMRSGNVILTTDNATQSVDFLKFPTCGCGFPTDECFCDHSDRTGEGSYGHSNGNC